MRRIDATERRSKMLAVKRQIATVVLLVVAGTFLCMADCPWQFAEQAWSDLSELFQKEVGSLVHVLDQAGVQEVWFPGTLVTSSGDAVFLVAPTFSSQAAPDPSGFCCEGGAFAVAWLTSPAVGTDLPPDIYLLSLVSENCSDFVVQFVDRNGRVKYTAPAASQFGEDCGSILEAGDGWLAWQLRDFRDPEPPSAAINLLDIEIRFGGSGPSKVYLSLLFWDIYLFEDP
jgi:hypothetical protein